MAKINAFRASIFLVFSSARGLPIDNAEKDGGAR